ncbi:MAG: aminoglycoside 6-adenylyltransferase [Clostridiaceae bacterium]|jgi:aminoglycoside 6-adenylyltransferase|nr:aminoglycoside 6-adenylyltransferase [Clostridiaceae bacterium]
MTRKRSRSEPQMLALLSKIAREEDRIRAVVLNGSRVDPGVFPDPFQDYDVVYVVTEVESFVLDPGWPSRFGELMIMQTPDDMGESAQRDPKEPRTSYAWLMQFADGTRVDLTAVRVDRRERVLEDSLRVLLLDKDGLFPPFPVPDDSTYHVQPPTQKQYDDCCNEFLWVTPYVAKALWRDQLSGARVMLEQLVRPQLLKMLTWHVGMRRTYAVSVGSYYKKLDALLSPAFRAALTRTWPDGDPEQMWDALLQMGLLFRRAAGEVASESGFGYPALDHRRVMAFVRYIRWLPPDADAIY